MECQTLFSGENKKKKCLFTKCRLLKLLLSILGVNGKMRFIYFIYFCLSKHKGPQKYLLDNSTIDAFF